MPAPPAVTTATLPSNRPARPASLMVRHYARNRARWKPVEYVVTSDRFLKVNADG
jgi:hypothetical protein